MEKIISILRGINVSGYRKVPMLELKELYHELKFKDVVTYIQSGNVIFSSSETDSKLLSKKIEQAILKKYDFSVPVIIRTVSDWQKILVKNPWLKEKNIDPAKLHVTFLSESPAKDCLEKIKAYNYRPDLFSINGKEVFLFCPNGYGNTRLTNTFFENKLKVTATTRNWKTVNELYKLASAS